MIITYMDFNQALAAVSEESQKAMAAVDSIESLEAMRIRFLGKKGQLTAVLQNVGALSPEIRRSIGEKANQIKTEILNFIDANKSRFIRASIESTLSDTALDPTLPGIHAHPGTHHPISQTIDKIIEILAPLGYAVKTGPNIETPFYNFEALNIPENHPARDMHDTFYLSPSHLLRTHTSPVQIHVMATTPPPLRIIAPGMVYRCDADASHSPVFHQIEGLVIDRTANFADMKGTLHYFLTELLGSDRKIRFRPSYFPFTEPSAEVDVSCMICDGSGCGLCKNTGWLEILGCGMVHPNVLQTSNISPHDWQGFAFGLGIERIAMLRFGIPDIRLFYENDSRFLRQFDR